MQPARAQASPLRWRVMLFASSRAPRKIGLLKVERPEIEFWEFEEYARILAAARKMEAAVYAGVCLAGEAGLRVGEVKGLRWRKDVDMVARTVAVNEQMRAGIVGTPKGRTRRTIPMTSTLFEALRSLNAVPEGYDALRARRGESSARAAGAHPRRVFARDGSGSARPRDARCSIQNLVATAWLRHI
jgi:integrase